MFCNKCGAELKGHETYCAKCGNRIVRTEKPVRETSLINERRDRKQGKTILFIVLGLVLLIASVTVALFIIKHFGDKNEVVTVPETEKGGTEVETVIETEEMQEVNANDIREVYQNKLSELILEYGQFDILQCGIMHTLDDEWMNPNGIISASIWDFDEDGVDEMLVCHTELSDLENSYNRNYYHIVMSMYEMVDGEVVLQDRVPFATYCDWREGIVDDVAQLSESEFCEKALSVHMLEDNYIVCEEFVLASNFSDGLYEAFWVMEYTDNHFEYVCSFAQNGAGSSGLQYIGYDFSEGTLVDSNLYYCEDWYDGIEEWNEDIPLYDDYAQAITEFFGKYDIKLNSSCLTNYDVTMGSILAEASEQTKIFEFTNQTMKAGYSNGVYEYQSSVSVGTNDILTRTEDDEPDIVVGENGTGLNEYILPESNSRYLSKTDLAGFTADECRLARNEIYARHGRKFDDEFLQSYFNSCEWYVPNIEADDFQESILNDYEIANRDLIVEYEKEQGYR